MPQEKKALSFKNIFTKITTIKAVVAIFLVGIATHANIFFNGFIGDDETQILSNPAVHSITNIPKLFLDSTFFQGGLYYKPLLSATFTLLYAVFAPHAMGFHAAQILLYIINAVLVFLIFRYFFTPLISLFLTLIFLVHPINTETAAYISDLPEVLFFFFGALAFYLNLRLQYSKKKMFLISVLLLLSLFSKESGILFMVALFCYEFIFRRKTAGHILFASTIAGIMYGIFRVGFAHLLFQTGSLLVMQAPIDVRLYSVPSVLFYYLRYALFPSDHAVLQVGLMTPKTLSGFLLALVSVLAFFAVVLWIGTIVYKKHRQLFQKYLFFLVFLIAGLLFYSQLFFPLDPIVADRWFYFPLIGLLGIVGVILQAVQRKLSFLPFSAKIILGLAFLGIFCTLTIFRNTLFASNLTLLSHDITFEPESGLLMGDLGYTLLQNGQYGQAEKYLLHAVQLEPKNAVVWDKLANYYYFTGQTDKSQRAFKKAISLDETNDQIYQNYAIFVFLYDNPKTTESIIQEGIQLFPTNGTLWQLYALTEFRLGIKANAISAAKQAYTYAPNFVTNTIYNRFLQNLPVDIQVYTSGKHRLFKVCPPECLESDKLLSQQHSVSDTTFTNWDMHVMFKFPYTLKITQLTRQLIAMSTSAKPKGDTAVLIYSAPMPTDTNTIPLPFATGTVQSVSALPLSGFQAQQATYTDGTVVILLRKKQQVIAIKIPKNSSSYEQAITDIINSIDTLR